MEFLGPHFVQEFDQVCRVEGDLEVESFILDHFLRVVFQLELVVPHCSLESQATEFDVLETVLVFLVFLSSAGLVTRPGDHEHVADLEHVLGVGGGLHAHDFLLDGVDEALGIEHALHALL